MGYSKLPFMEESFIGRGVVTLDIWANGAASGGEIHMGNNTQVVIEKSEDEVATLDDYTGVVTVPLAEAQKKLGYAIKITNTEYSRKILAMALFGIDSDFSQNAAAVVDEPLTARLDKWVKLTKRNLASDPAMVVTNEAGTTTYVKDTDYTVDNWTGRIKCLSTGAITEGQALKVDFSCLALTGFKIQGMAKTEFDVTIRFTGIDMQHQTRSVELVVYKARIKPTKGLDLITDEHASNEFEGKILSTASGYFDFFVFQE